METTILTEEHAERLLAAIRKHGPAVVDWTNHKIEIWSERKVNPKVRLSTGPMEYWDVLFGIYSSGEILDELDHDEYCGSMEEPCGPDEITIGFVF